MKPAHFDNEAQMTKASILFLHLLSAERNQPPPKITLDVDWEQLIRKDAAGKVRYLRACGYSNNEIAPMLGYKDGRSVNSCLQRVKHRERMERDRAAMGPEVA